MATDAHQQMDRLRTELMAADLARLATKIGLSMDKGQVRIDLFGRPHWIDADGNCLRDGKPVSDTIAMLLCRYLIHFPEASPSPGPLMTYRELPGAGPLVASFTRNTNKIIASHFAECPEKLVAAARSLAGRPVDGPSGFDVKLVFAALPAVFMHLQFNARDDLFAAQCDLLLNPSAVSYLDMTSLFALGTYLTGHLIRFGN